jgi:hypothetical protein
MTNVDTIPNRILLRISWSRITDILEQDIQQY